MAIVSDPRLGEHSGCPVRTLAPEMLQVTRIRPESLVHTLYLNLTVAVRDLIEMPYGVGHILNKAPHCVSPFRTAANTAGLFRECPT